MTPVIPVLVCMMAAPSAPLTLAERTKAASGTWEAHLSAGEPEKVRREVEPLLLREGGAVNPADYREMDALAALRGLAARACAADGAWEDALEHHQKAQSTAETNLATATPRLSTMRAAHISRIKELNDGIARYEPRLKELEGTPDLDAGQQNYHRELKRILDEQRTEVREREGAIKSIDAILARLRDTQATCAQAATTWQGFLDKEKASIAAAGGAPAYVAAKVGPVKAGGELSRGERLTHARRLRVLDPENRELPALIRELQAADGGKAKAGERR